MMRATVNPPGPGGLPIGLPYGSSRTDAATYLLRVAARFGDVVRLRIPSGVGYLVSHPDAIKHVLVTRSRDFIKSRGLERVKRLLGEGLLTSEGELHVRQRRLAQPAFHRDRIADYGAVMTAYAARYSERWHSPGEFDAAREMTRLTLAIAGKTLFDADVETDAEDVWQALTELQSLLPASLAPFSELFDWMPLPANVRFWHARARLDAIIYRIIDEHRRSGDRGDLLSMLLAARDGGADGAGMSIEQIRDECMTLLLAGHETTANALTWTWYLLSRHPDVERRLHEELDGVLRGRSPTVGDLDGLPYAHMVVQESLRLYPPAWLLGRRALQPFSIGGFSLPARAILLISPFVVHRDSRWYDDPSNFDPERFGPIERAKRPKYAYVPFGAGPRVCIGESFAWMETVLVLATIAQRWHLRVSPTYQPQMTPLITLRPKGGMPVVATRRMVGKSSVVPEQSSGK
jgi:cytochrome P450